MCCPKRGILGIALEITGIQILPECLLDIRYFMCILSFIFCNDPVKENHYYFHFADTEIGLERSRF
jgi:hypothetical protein